MKNVTWKMAMTRTGPNNTSCIVWAIYKPVLSWTEPGSEGGDDRAGRLLPPPSPLLPKKAWGTFAPWAFGMFFFYTFHHQEKGRSYPCVWHTDINWCLDCNHKAFIPNIISMFKLSYFNVRFSFLSLSFSLLFCTWTHFMALLICTWPSF